MLQKAKKRDGWEGEDLGTAKEKKTTQKENYHEALKWE